MSALLLILLSAALVNVVALTSAPRWRPFLALPDPYRDAWAIAWLCLIAVPAVTALSRLLSAAVLGPLELHYLSTPACALIALIVALVLEGALQRDGRRLPRRPAFALLMASNPAVVGVALLAPARTQGWFDAVSLAMAAALALAALVLAFAAIQERLRAADVPRAFREAPLALVTTGIAALAFMGFTGLVQE